MAGWREKLKAATHGEVSRADLDPYKVAGAGVYEYVMELDARDKAGAAGQLPAHLQVSLLAGWVAFALQVLGDEMLDADAELDPSTAHYVPVVTAAQVMAFYDPVQSWMAMARAAKANPSYRSPVELPAVLPEWVEVEPCPQAHLVAMRSALNRLADYTQGIMSGFDPGPGLGYVSDLVAQASAEASSAGDYANGLWGATSGPPPARMHEAIEANLKTAAETHFYLGQVLAMPRLAELPRRVGEDHQASEGGLLSFLESVVRSYPQARRQRSGGMLGGLGGGLLGGVIGGEIAREIFGGGGDDGGWGGF